MMTYACVSGALMSRSVAVQIPSCRRAVEYTVTLLEMCEDSKQTMEGKSTTHPVSHHYSPLWIVRQIRISRMK
jgi:hypothetical protein